MIIVERKSVGVSTKGSLSHTDGPVGVHKSEQISFYVSRALI